MSNETVVQHHRSWGVWKLGDGLWWRDERGIHGTVLASEPEYGPRGGRKEPGDLVTIDAPTLDALNEALAELGFDPLNLEENEIAWTGKGLG